MLKEFGIYSQVEIDSRFEVLLDSYCKSIQVEGLTALKMAKNEIYPACIKYLNELAETSLNVSKNNIDNSFLVNDVRNVASLIANMKVGITELEAAITKAQQETTSSLNQAYIWRDEVLVSMKTLRNIVDELETIVSEKYWPMPTYVDLLFGI
jgi:glutamine synthetase